MRLLCIANPDVYGNTRTDVPLSYVYLAAHPKIALFHADTNVFLRRSQQIDAVPINPSFSPDEFIHLPSQQKITLSPDDVDLTFCRTLKPFPTDYVDCLSDWSRTLRFVNNPNGLRKQLDHRFLLRHAGEYLPSSINTVSQRDAEQFFLQHHVIVIKQANSCGGRGVFRVCLRPDNSLEVDNAIQGQRVFRKFSELFSWLSRGGRQPLTLSKYLPRVVEGDKRIVVVGGEIYGAYLRKSPSGHWVQNVSLGSHCELTTATTQEQKIIAATWGNYRDEGLHVLGYDFLRDDGGDAKLSEINAGNIGGLARLEQLGQSGTIDRFVHWLHRHHASGDIDILLESCTSLQSALGGEHLALRS